jgi:hypothetical protein
MRQRCINTQNDSYARYGGRGITICPEWESFEVFAKEMGDGYSDALQLDRIDNNKGYSKENCRWVTCRENTNNRSITRFALFEDALIPVSIIAEKLGVSIATVVRHAKHKGELCYAAK